MADRTNYHNRYAALWAWTVLVTACAGALWWFAYDVAQAIIQSIEILKKVKAATSAYEWAQWAIVTIGFALIWWRVVKVVVLQGAPFLVGPSDRIGGREDKGESGRPVFMSFIGNLEVNMNDISADYKGSFLFGCIIRSHARSDKLVRARLEFLILALPFNGRLTVHNSRFSFKREDHKHRARRFRQIHDNYSATRMPMSEGHFRQRVTQALDELAKRSPYSSTSIRINNMYWRFYGDGNGSISDDFGNSLLFQYNESTEEFTTVVGGVDVKMKSFQELNTVAEKQLSPSPF